MLVFFCAQIQQYLASWASNLPSDFLPSQLAQCIGRVRWLDSLQSFRLPAILSFVETWEPPLIVQEWKLRQISRTEGEHGEVTAGVASATVSVTTTSALTAAAAHSKWCSSMGTRNTSSRACAMYSSNPKSAALTEVKPKKQGGKCAENLKTSSENVCVQHAQ